MGNHFHLLLLVMLLLVPASFSGSVAGLNLIPLDKFGNQLWVAGAQPSGFGFALMLSGTDLSAKNTFTVSSNQPLFRVPSGNWAVVVGRSGKGGADCWANYTTGSTTSMTWTLSLLDGACSIPAGVIIQMEIPQPFAAPNPGPGYVKIYGVSTGTSSVYVNSLYQAYAVIYATPDPRNSDDSASYLVGGGQPGFMNIGFTTTWQVNAAAVIQLTSSNSAFRRPGSSKFAIPITGTGCTATLTTTGTGTTSQLRFTLSGSSCQITPNVAVEGSQFQLPAALLNTNPVDTAVSITVTVIVGANTYPTKNGNPGTYTTTNGCSAWSAWSSCSASCGTGYTYRTRTGESSSCTTTMTSRPCNSIACGCTPWSAWGSCSATCGGTISRTRKGSKNCNVATVDTQSCGPTDCRCPWTQTSCTSSCGSGVRTRKVTPRSWWDDCGDNLEYKVVCNETFTTESLACPCKDIPWTDRFGSTCDDYVKNNWCTISGGYGPGWDFTKPGFRSFDYRTNNDNNALSACCACGKNKCVKDTVLLIDQSASIATSDWNKIKQYITDRVSQTKFTDEYGNRIGVVQFDVAAAVLCPLTWDQQFLLDCISRITFPAGPGTATSAGLELARTVIERYSSPNRTRIVEMLTDGSPNIPRTDPEGAAFSSAYALKDSGVTIVTIGMGIACATADSTDCLNREVLNTMASEPASSYAVLLASYDSLKAMSLFISSQCTAQLAGFDPSPSPIPEYSPDPSASPSPFAKPSPSPAASASPAASLSPAASASPQASASPRPSASPAASSSPRPSVSPAASASPRPSASPAASTSPAASASPATSASPAASASPAPSASPAASASPVASASPRASASPKASASPWPSRSPWASASPLKSPIPSDSPLPSPSPDAEALCQAQEALVPVDWMLQNVNGCGKDAVAYLLRQYRCVELQPSCGTFECSLYVPPSVILQIQSSCNTITL